jgi:hypothetical protein
MEVLAMADEAAEGAGFFPLPRNGFANYVLKEYKRSLRDRADLPFLPHSLCWWVDPSEAVVQPKAVTPEVGCTLRWELQV